MKIELHYIEIHNFKGISDYSLKLDGKSATIEAENDAGKSSLADAWYWLISGKNQELRTDFNILPLDEDGNTVNHVDADVKALISVNGNKVELRKLHRQKWQKKRGAPTPDLIGHSTEYVIDGIELSTKKEYDDRIAEIIDDDLFRLLSDIRYMCGLTKADYRRNILLDLCGYISDEQVIKDHKNKNLKELNGEVIPDLKKINKKKLKESQRIIDNNPTIVAELSKGLIEGRNVAYLEKELKSISDRIEHLKSSDSKLYRKELTIIERDIRSSKSEKERLISDWRRIKNCDINICETCGQRLTAEMIFDAEANQQLKIRQINILGKRINETIKNLENEKEELIEKLNLIDEGDEQQLIDLTRQYDEVDNQIRDARHSERLKTRINELENNSKRAIEDFQESSRILSLIEQFDRYKAEFIEKNVNNHFDIVKWKLFDHQMNGGIRDICEPTIGGVPYSTDLNNGNKILAGIDCIKAIGKHYDINVPVFIDNYEALTSDPNLTDIQVIRLVAKKGKKELTAKFE